MRKLFFIVSLLAMSVSGLHAHEFEAVSPSGHTLFYDAVPGGAMVVGWDYPSDETEPIHLVIPPHVTGGSVNLHVIAIGENAFANCDRLMAVSMPSSVRTIGSGAFRGCYGLGSLTLPPTVDSIAPDAFVQVPNVEYGGSAQGAPWGALCVNAYHEGALYYTDAQKTHLVCCERDAADVTLPPTVSTIGEYAFARCYNITSVSVEDHVTELGFRAFIHCQNLSDVFFNPRLASLSSGAECFYECVNLRNLTLGESVENIPSYFCTGCTSLKSIVIPNGVHALGESLFEGCTSLESAVIGGGVYEISSLAFANCTSLRQVAMASSIRSIRRRAFKDCRSLHEVVLPSSIFFVDYYSFAGCNSIDRIVCMANSVPHAARNSFDGIDADIELVVPCGKEELYGQDTDWNYFSNFVGQQYYMDVSSNNLAWGHAVATHQPTCDDNLAVIEAVAADGCRFVRWDDGNADNPRQIAHTGGGIIRRVAMFESDLSVGGAEALPVVSVYVSNGDIVVEGAQGEMVWLFDMMGREWFSAKASSSSFTVPSRNIPTAGVYLIKVGSCKARKIVMP